MQVEVSGEGWRELNCSKKVKGKLLVERPGDGVSKRVAGGRADGNGNQKSPASLVCGAVMQTPSHLHNPSGRSGDLEQHGFETEKDPVGLLGMEVFLSLVSCL